MQAAITEYNPLLLPRDALAAYCRQNGIRSPALFGSHLRGDAKADSDIDLLFAMEPERRT